MPSAPDRASAGAAISRLKPTTPSTVCGVGDGHPVEGRARAPAGRVARVDRRLPRVDGDRSCASDSPLRSVAVTLISYHVSADASPVVGIVNVPTRPVSGPTNGWMCVPWCSRTSVLMSRVVEVEAGRVVGERVVGDRVAGPVRAPSTGAATVSVGGDADLDDDRLGRDMVLPGRRLSAWTV